MVSRQVQPSDIAVVGQAVRVDAEDAVVFQYQVEKWSMMENMCRYLLQFIVWAQFGWWELEKNSTNICDLLHHIGVVLAFCFWENGFQTIFRYLTIYYFNDMLLSKFRTSDGHWMTSEVNVKFTSCFVFYRGLNIIWKTIYVCKLYCLPTYHLISINVFLFCKEEVIFDFRAIWTEAICHATKKRQKTFVVWIL